MTTPIVAAQDVEAPGSHGAGAQNDLPDRREHRVAPYLVHRGSSREDVVAKLLERYPPRRGVAAERIGSGKARLWLEQDGSEPSPMRKIVYSEGRHFARWSVTEWSVDGRALVLDVRYWDTGDPLPAFDTSALTHIFWGHYGDRGEGIVIEDPRLIEQITALARTQTHTPEEFRLYLPYVRSDGALAPPVIEQAPGSVCTHGCTRRVEFKRGRSIVGTIDGHIEVGSMDCHGTANLALMVVLRPIWLDWKGRKAALMIINADGDVEVSDSPGYPSERIRAIKRARR